MPPSGRVTIADVAAASGVGVGTVSRVINGAANVRESTRRTVLVVIKELGYRPSYLAASLSRGTPRTVAIIAPHLTAPSAVMRLVGALAVLDEHDYDSVVCNVDTPEQRDHHLTALTSRYRVDGVIMISPEYNHGMSGVLKNGLDWASRPYGRSALMSKPVLTMTASPAFTSRLTPNNA